MYFEGKEASKINTLLKSITLKKKKKLPFWNCVFIPENLFQFWKEEKKNPNHRIRKPFAGASSKNSMAKYVLAVHVVMQLCLIMATFECVSNVSVSFLLI